MNVKHNSGNMIANLIIVFLLGYIFGVINTGIKFYKPPKEKSEINSKAIEKVETKLNQVIKDNGLATAKEEVTE